MNLAFRLLILAPLLHGCSTNQSHPENSIESDAVYIGQFKSVEEFNVAQGDVIEVWNRYQFEILHHIQIEFVSSGSECRVNKITDDYFVVFLTKQLFLSRDGEEEEFQTVLCIKMDSETENYVNRAMNYK
jgi:hypothetical protein